MKKLNPKELKNKLAQSFYTTAIGDLLSARCLYQDRKYPNSIFFLQQSTEKLNKATGLCLDMVNSKNLRRINHYPHRIYKEATKDRLAELAQHEEYFKKIVDNSEQLDNYKGQLNESLKALQNLNEHELRYLSLEELDEFLELIIQPSHSSEENFIVLRETLTAEMREFYDKIPVEGSTLTKHLQQLHSKGKGPAIEQIAELEIYSIILNKSLLLLSLILSPHQNTTRYPCEECGSMPSEEYNSDHPLIARFDVIDSIVVNCMYLFEIIFNNIQGKQKKGDQAES